MTETRSRRESSTDPIRRYGSLSYGALGSMLDIGLVVVGTLLVGLALATLFGGFDFFGSLPEMSAPAVLGSSLILAIVGLFALGIAAEGPLGRGRTLIGYSVWEIGIARAIAAFLVGFGFLLVDGFITGFLGDLPDVFRRGSEGIHAAAVAGMVVVPLVAVPITMLIRLLPDRYRWAQRYDSLVIFVIWVVATMAGM